jgi:hypothetical protein
MIKVAEKVNDDKYFETSVMLWSPHTAVSTAVWDEDKTNYCQLFYILV